MILTELPGDPRGVLLHLDTREYYTVNESGLFLLRGLRKGATVDDLASGLRSRFRMQEDVAQGEVRRFLDRLGREGLLAE